MEPCMEKHETLFCVTFDGYARIVLCGINLYKTIFPEHKKFMLLFVDFSH